MTTITKVTMCDTCKRFTRHIVFWNIPTNPPSTIHSVVCLDHEEDTSEIEESLEEVRRQIISIKVRKREVAWKNS